MPFSIKNLAAIRDSVVVTLGAVAVRQLLLLAAGALLPWASRHGILEIVGLALFALIVLAWGQYRSWKAAKAAKDAGK